ncbi:hypothetical protein M6B38_208110 [Iris pallida]|uniref:Uncharacterized protein n=1 Tax=Iris pallida TaxID=29817 RepID=A0AAX6E5H6_IRIPA|nr:hypothetical protein M6B38_208110 [Iris pallida]
MSSSLVSRFLGLHLHSSSDISFLGSGRGEFVGSLCQVVRVQPFMCIPACVRVRPGIRVWQAECTSCCSDSRNCSMKC